MICDHLFADDVPHVKLTTAEQVVISEMCPTDVDMMSMRRAGADKYVSALEAMSVNQHMTPKEIEVLNAEITLYYYQQSSGKKTYMQGSNDPAMFGNRLSACLVELMAHPNLEPKLVSLYLGVHSPCQAITTYNGTTFNPSISTDQMYEFLKYWSTKFHMFDAATKNIIRQLFLHFKHESPDITDDLFHIVVSKSIMQTLNVAGVVIKHPECTPHICQRLYEALQTLIRSDCNQKTLSYYKPIILRLIQHKNFDRNAANMFLTQIFDITGDCDYISAEAKELFMF